MLYSEATVNMFPENPIMAETTPKTKRHMALICW